MTDYAHARPSESGYPEEGFQFVLGFGSSNIPGQLRPGHHDNEHAH
jgi:hypothetical protein